MGMLPKATVNWEVLSEAQKGEQHYRKICQVFRFHRLCWIALFIFQLMKPLKCRKVPVAELGWNLQRVISSHLWGTRSPIKLLLGYSDVILYMQDQHRFPFYSALSKMDEAFLIISPLKNALIIYSELAEIYALYFLTCSGKKILLHFLSVFGSHKGWLIIDNKHQFFLFGCETLVGWRGQGEG